jgi:suppressor of G2 allele of SKP1
MVSFDFSETQSFVNLTFFKSPLAGKNDIKITLNEEGTVLFYKQSLENPSNSCFELNLYLPVELSAVKEDALKIEVELKKKVMRKWHSIDGNVEKVSVNEDIYLEEKEEEREAMDMTSLFKDIYSKGNEDIRKAMNKSLQESGGTVLSTNWNEVKNKDIKPEK